MPQVGFEPMPPAIERGETIHALDRIPRGHYDRPLLQSTRIKMPIRIVGRWLDDPMTKQFRVLQYSKFHFRINRISPLFLILYYLNSLYILTKPLCPNKF